MDSDGELESWREGDSWVGVWYKYKYVCMYVYV